MVCQRFTSPEYNRDYVGTNLRVIAAPQSCIDKYGFNLMVLADCWQTGAGPEIGGGWCFRGSYQIVTIDDSLCPNCAPTSVNTSQPYDCINGGCVPKSTYGTPGIYASLAACQSGCAKNSSCTGECVDPHQIAALKQAVSKLKNRLCG